MLSRSGQVRPLVPGTRPHVLLPLDLQQRRYQPGQLQIGPVERTAGHQQGQLQTRHGFEAEIPRTQGASVGGWRQRRARRRQREEYDLQDCGKDVEKICRTARYSWHDSVVESGTISAKSLRCFFLLRELQFF